MMTDATYSYRSGLREGVAFLLVDDRGRTLLECRPVKNGDPTDIFYPSGSIEMKDHIGDGFDYREVALRREIAEEFRDGVAVERLEFLGDVEIPRSASCSTSTGWPFGPAIPVGTLTKTELRSATCAGRSPKR